MKQLWNKQIKIGVTLFTALVLSSSFVLADFQNVDCVKNQKVLGISTLECQVLEKLWTSTNGKDWQENQNWDSLTKVSTWDGVVVENSKISSLLLYSNNLVGTIPLALGKLSALKRLSLSNNKLKGKVPESLGELSELRYLDLGNNNLNSIIPQTLGSLSNLTELYLNNNQFSGNIPDSLGDLASLNVLKIYGNNLSGSIPITFGALSNLVSLSLAENSLTGSIPLELGELTKLSFLDLKSNKLSGEIPAQLGDLESLGGVYLQDNKLTGVIPSRLGNLLSLTSLDLSNNKLIGELPSTFGQLLILTYLNVSNNELSGDIPLELLDLSRLNYLNLGENQFAISSIEAINSELSYIPEYIISSEKTLKTESVTNVISDNSSEKKSKAISIEILNEDEVAILEVATLKIVGTEEYGDSLTVNNEGIWSIEDRKIIFTPLKSFDGIPKSISYTIKNGDGVESAPIEIFIKRNKSESLNINLLEGKQGELFLVKISLSETFINEHSEYTLSDDKKELFVDGEGRWIVESNGIVTFTPNKEFRGNPANIEYSVFKKGGDKSAMGIIDMSSNPVLRADSDYANTVELFGINGLLLMMLFGGLYGVFYIREIENKKL